MDPADGCKGCQPSERDLLTPRWTVTTVSAAASRSGLCDTTIHAAGHRAGSAFQIARAVWASSEESQSSTTYTSAGRHSIRARARRCRWPPESSWASPELRRVLRPHGNSAEPGRKSTAVMASCMRCSDTLLAPSTRLSRSHGDHRSIVEPASWPAPASTSTVAAWSDHWEHARIVEVDLERLSAFAGACALIASGGDEPAEYADSSLSILVDRDGHGDPRVAVMLGDDGYASEALRLVHRLGRDRLAALAQQCLDATAQPSAG